MSMSRKRTPQDFLFKEQLGHGSYSTVYKAVDRSTGQVFAIKVCSKKHIISEKKVKYVTIEKNTMNLLANGNHPGIIKLYYTFHDPENLYFVLDLAPGGELLQLLQSQGRFSEAWSRHFMCQLVDSLEYIHSCKVVHRDLKPENLLLSSEGRLMITDFGVASNLDSSNDNLSSSSSFVGTAEYVSPELLLQNKSNYCSDVWALGCMLYQFSQGTPPFKGENELATFEKIVNLDYRWICSVSPLVMDLVSNILVIDPAVRYTIPQIKKHAWFSEVDWSNKEAIWKGIWQVYRKSDRVPANAAPLPASASSSSPSSSSSLIANKQLHVIDTPIKNIPIQPRKRKPMKVTQTTSSIVEWRKTLGISPVAVSIGSNGLPKRPKTPVSHQQPRPPHSNPQFHVARPPSQEKLTSARNTVGANLHLVSPKAPPITPVSPSRNSSNTLPSPVKYSNSKRPLTPPTSPTPLKQGWVKILEIPYIASPQKIFSHKEYSFIDDKLITKFIAEEKSHIVEESMLCLLTLEPSGQFSYTPKGGATKQMISIIDEELSIYDLEFNEAKNSGYLIFEKFKSILWLIALPKSAPNDFTVNSGKTWISSLFKIKAMLESEKLSKKVDNLSLKSDSTSSSASSPSPPQSQPPPPPTPTSASSSSRHPKASNNRMFVSSSRAEVLYTLNRGRNGSTDAANGASAAFKNMHSERA